jgi:hypothetical protein
MSKILLPNTLLKPFNALKYHISPKKSKLSLEEQEVRDVIEK